MQIGSTCEVLMYLLYIALKQKIIDVITGNCDWRKELRLYLLDSR